MSTTAFAAFQQHIKAGAVLGSHLPPPASESQSTPGHSSGHSDSCSEQRPQRQRNRTERGAVYDEEREQEMRGKKPRKPDARKIIYDHDDDDDDDELGPEEHAEEDADPYANDSEELPNPSALTKIRESGAFSSKVASTPAAKQPHAPPPPMLTSLRTASTAVGTSHSRSSPKDTSRAPRLPKASNPREVSHGSRHFGANIGNKNLPPQSADEEQADRGRIPHVSNHRQPSPSPSHGRVRNAHVDAGPANKGKKRTRAPPGPPSPSPSPSPHSESDHHTSSSSHAPPPKKRKNNKNGTSTRSRPKARDLDRLTRGVLDLVIADYRSLLATECPFPNETEEQTMAGAALARAAVAREVNAGIEDQQTYDMLIDLIIARDSHMRGELKTKLVPLVATHYGFDATGTPRAIKKNRKLAELLKTNNCIAYKASSACDHIEHKELYESRLIQNAINIMWFVDPEDEGVKFEDYFKPIPLKTIALVLTAIEFVIDRWSTGIYRKTAHFTAKGYQDSFEKHLGALEELKAHNEEHAKKVKHLQHRLLSQAQLAAGVTSVNSDAPLLSTADLDAFVADDVAEESDDSDADDEMDRSDD